MEIVFCLNSTLLKRISGERERTQIEAFTQYIPLDYCYIFTVILYYFKDENLIKEIVDKDGLNISFAESNGEDYGTSLLDQHTPNN